MKIVSTSIIHDEHSRLVSPWTKAGTVGILLRMGLRAATHEGMAMVGKQLLLYDEALLDPHGKQPFHLLPLRPRGGRGGLLCVACS